MKRLVIALLTIIVTTTIMIIVSMPIYNYYVYTLPMKDPLIGYGGSDFHYLPIEQAELSFQAIKDITLLEDGSINVEFKPDRRYVNYNGVHYTHFETIRVNQTFITSCQYPDNSNKTLRIYPSYEELKKAYEESIVIVYDADEEYFKNNCDDDFIDNVSGDKLCKRLYDDFLRNETISVSKTYGYTKPYLDKEFYDKPLVNILKYMGIGNFNGAPVYGFHHVHGYLRDKVPCDYPQVIEHSIDLVDIEIPDWYICRISDSYRPTLVLDELRDSDMCAEYE